MPITFSNQADVSWMLTQDRTLAPLRKETAPLILTFLFYTFQLTNLPTCAGGELHARLTDLKGEKKRIGVEIRFISYF